VKRSISVCLDGQSMPFGLLYYEQMHRREFSAFAYHPSWLASPERFTIDPQLALAASPQFHRRSSTSNSIFHGAIADTEPDGWGRRVILREHAKRRHRTREKSPREGLKELDFLLSVDDISRVGSLRFQDHDGTFLAAEIPGKRTTPPLIELDALLSASRAVEERTETAEDLAYLLGCGTSLGGIRPKCTILDHDGHLAIGKFPSVTDERAVTKGEVLALQLARDAGIDAAQARVVMSRGSPVALIRRFDRVGKGRLLFVSAATLLQAHDTADEHSYTEIVEAMLRYSVDFEHDAHELWRRIAFSVLITNLDDHLRNHGFLHILRGQWRLSPAFDINPFPERHREFKLWISEEAGPQATIDGVMSVAPYFRIPLRKARAILRDVENAVAGWRKQGSAIGMTTRELQAFEEAFEHDERRVARNEIARA
jgi:serine/threonine-protein kinase HipA